MRLVEVSLMMLECQASSRTTDSVETIGDLARCSCCSVGRLAFFISSQNLANKEVVFSVSVQPPLTANDDRLPVAVTSSNLLR